MIVRVCLLISDDPDEYIEFPEALYEVAPDAVLVAVADVTKAANLLESGKCMPHFIFLNLANGANNTHFFNVVSRDQFIDTKIFAWGDGRDLPNHARSQVLAFLDADATFAQLKQLLKKVMAIS